MKIIVNINKLICKTKILIIIFCVSQPTFAEKISLNEINNYINGLTMLQADFEQINSDGSIDTGKLYIRRPGKMRLEYAAPSNALVIVGAGSVSIFDDKSKNGPTLFPLKENAFKSIIKERCETYMENEMITEHTAKNEEYYYCCPKILRGNLKVELKWCLAISPVSLQRVGR